jgi:hypothetical protein
MRVLDLMFGLTTGAVVFFGVANALKVFGRNGLLEFGVSVALALVVAILLVNRKHHPAPARLGARLTVAVLVTAAVAVGVNEVQLARWPEGCNDVLPILVEPTASPSCAPPNLTDVPLPWLGPLLGFAGGLGAMTGWFRRRTRTSPL